MATVQEPTRQASRHERFVQQELSRAVRRVRLLDVTRAGLGLAIAVMAYGLVMMLADRWLNLPQSVRQVSLLGFFGFAALYAWFIVLAPIRRAVNPYYAAVQVEQTIPDAKNSLVNWLDLHDDGLPAGVISAIDQRAAEDLKDTDVQQAIHSSSLAWLAGIALGLIVGFLACFIIFRGDQFSSLLGRAFSPFGTNTGIVKQTRISILTPPEGDLTVAINRSVTITARVEGRIPATDRPDSMRLLVRYSPDEPVYEERTLEQSPDSAAEWTFRLPPNQVRTGFWYKVAGGDDETPEYRVQVRSSPSIARFEVLRKYRPYLRWEPRTTDDPNIEDWRGTEITLDAVTNRRVRDGKLILESEGKHRAIEAQLLPDRPELMRFRFTLEKDAKYRIWFTTTDDESNNDPLPYTVHVLQDQAPTVEFIKPEAETTLAADALLRIEGRAIDDFGIRKMTLRMTLDGQPLKPRDYLSAEKFRLDTGGFMRFVDYKDDVDLMKLESPHGLPVQPKTGETIEYWLEAEDNCDFPGPQVGSSKKYKVKIASPKVDDRQQPKNDDEKKELDAKKEERSNERQQSKAEKKQHDDKHEQDRQKQSEQDRAEQQERNDKFKQEERDRMEKQNKQQGGAEQPQKPDPMRDDAEPPKDQGQQDKSEGNKPNGDPKADDTNNEGAKPPEKSETKPAPPDAEEPKPGEKPPEPAGDKPNTGGQQDKAAEPKPSDQKQDGGSAPGESKNPPAAKAPQKSEDKKPGDAGADPSGMSDAKKPPQDGADKGMSDAKSPPKPADKSPMDKPGGGSQQDPMAKPDEPGAAKGNPRNQPPNANPAGNPKDPAAKPQDKKPGEGGMGESKNDQPPQAGAAKKGPKPEDQGNANVPAEQQPQPQPGDSKPKEAPRKADAKPDQTAQKNAGRQGEEKPAPGGSPMNADNAASAKQDQKNPMGAGEVAKGEKKPDQGAGNQDATKQDGPGGKDDVAKTEQEKAADAKNRDDVKQALENIAKNDSDPKRRQAAQELLKDIDKAEKGQEGVAKLPPQQSKPGEPMPSQQPPVAQAKNPPQQPGQPGDEKRSDKGNPQVAKSDAKDTQPPRSEIKNAPKESSTAKSEPKPGDKGQPTGDGKPASEQVAKSDPKPGPTEANGGKPGDKGPPKDPMGANNPMVAQGTPMDKGPMPANDGDPMKGGKTGDSPAEAKNDPAAPGTAKQKDQRPGPQGGTPGDSRDLTAQAGASVSPEQKFNPMNPNEEYKKRSGDLTLNQDDLKKLKEHYQKKELTKEDEARLYAELAKNKATPPTPKDLEAARRRGTGLNTGPRRVTTPSDKDLSTLQAGSTGQAPLEYREAAKKFAEELNKVAEPKPK